MKVVAIIQARMTSTRLPGKVLMDIGGDVMLARVVERVRRAKKLSKVVVAATENPADDRLAEFCRRRGWPCFRGSEEDVLDRYYRAAKEHGADVVVRVTSDCPRIDPVIIHRVVGEFLGGRGEIDYASNVAPTRTFPRGQDTEVFSFEILERVWREVKDPGYREHVTLHIYSHPDRYRIACVTNDVDYSHMRWTVDTPEDMAFARKIYEHFGHDRFSFADVIGALGEHPEWLEINRGVVQKKPI